MEAVTSRFGETIAAHATLGPLVEYQASVVRRQKCIFCCMAGMPCGPELRNIVSLHISEQGVAFWFKNRRFKDKERRYRKDLRSRNNAFYFATRPTGK